MDSGYLSILLLGLITCVSCGPIASSFTMLQDSDRKPDIKELLPFFQFLQKPKEGDKNIAKLLYQLGDSYDTKFMSVLQPDTIKAHEPSQGEVLDITDGSTRSNPVMPSELKNMKFVVKKSNGKRREFGKKITHKFQQWLWNLSKCPVRYKWIDLGENIFPRFLKRGTCSKKATCSYPAGMKCEPSTWKNITVLLYTCLKEINSITTNCKWRPMSIDILTECSCGCHHK